MTKRVHAILQTIKRLTESEQKDLIAEIVRRSARLSWPPLTDDELVFAAEELFLRLDKEEMSDESSGKR